MKNIPLVVIILFMLLNNVYAEENINCIQTMEEYGLCTIGNGKLQENDSINRFCAAMMICESIGFTHKTYDKMTNINFYNRSFFDIDDQVYIKFAAYKNIIVGTDKVEENPSLFEPNRYITYEEAVAMISRCLKSDNDTPVFNKSLDETWDFAKNNNIIYEDEFSALKHDKITYSDFCTLLCRMIKQPVYIDTYNEINNLYEKTYEDVLNIVGAEEIRFYKDIADEIISSSSTDI